MIYSRKIPHGDLPTVRPYVMTPAFYLNDILLDMVWQLSKCRQHDRRLRVRSLTLTKIKF